MSDDLIHKPGGGLPRLLEIMRRLRDPSSGCPWDIEQTYKTIAPYTIEEAYEVEDAVNRNDFGDLKAELGDLLLQVVYFAQMGSEDGHFDFQDISDAISDKMVARHPHVFGDTPTEKSAEQQTQDWETLKAQERNAKGPARVLDGIALNLPAMTRAIKLQKRAARVGFDWPTTDGVISKLIEEAKELTEPGLSQQERTEEFGDLLFVVANLARHLKIDPEGALRATNRKFTRRFEYIEDQLAKEHRTPTDSNLAEMDRLWDAAKKDEKAK